MNLSVNCTATGTNMTVGLGSNYVGEYFHYRRQGEIDWSRGIPLNGTPSDDRRYLRGGAQAVIPSIVPGTTYEVRANICRKEGSTYKCNCTNAACTTENYWTLQAFRFGTSTTPSVYVSPDVTTRSRFNNDGVVLRWALPATTAIVPEDGYDIAVDGVFSEANKTTDTKKTIVGLSLGRHCFDIRARWTQADPDALMMDAGSRTCVDLVNRGLYPRPTLSSATVSGNSVTLRWTMPSSTVGAPKGGYDMVVDGVKRTLYRTKSLTQVINGLSAGEHCFAVNARYTGISPVLVKKSNEKCVTVQ